MLVWCVAIARVCTDKIACLLFHMLLFVLINPPTRSGPFLSVQRKARDAKKNKKKACSGSAAGNVAMKRRKDQLVSEARTRRYDEDQVTQELSYARVARHLCQSSHAFL